MRRYELTVAQAALVHGLASDRCKALHNWIASAIEVGKVERSQEMVKELREYERIAAATNVEAHKLIDAAAASDKQSV